MYSMQSSYTVVKLLYDVHTCKGVFKSGEVHILESIRLGFLSLKIDKDHYHCLHEETYEIIEENKKGTNC